MLQNLVELSLRRRGITVALACVLAGYGLGVASRARLDVFPDFVPPQVAIQTEAPGLSPEEVEIQVTSPIEQSVSGLGDLESLRSESIQGLSILTAVFREGSDVFASRQLLSENLAELAGRLPVGVSAPRMTPLTSSTMDLLKIGLVSERLSALELRSFAEWTLKPRLLAVPGVAKASLFGGELRQLQIQVDPARMHARGLALGDVLEAARAATGVVGAGFIDTPGQRVVLETQGQTLDPVALGQAVIAQRAGRSVRLADVAQVGFGAAPKFGDTLIQGGPGVLLTLSSQYGANTLEVTRALELALAEMQPVFEREGIALHPRLHRPASFIESSLRNIGHSLLLGSALVAGVLLLFLGHLRSALISLTAIPLSLLAALIAMDALGISLNTITIGGLAIAIGEVVDDAIIDVENILRRLRENRGLVEPRSAFRVVLDASLEVRTAVVYATFVVALVFMPVLSLGGLAGSFFAPLAQAYILAILASLGVALTLTPALSLLLLRSDRGDDREPAVQKWLRDGYRRVLQRVAGAPRRVIAAVAAACVAAAALLPFLGGEFLPAFREGHFVLQVSAAPGSSLEELLRIGRGISEALLATGKVATVEQQLGRAELGEDPWGPHRSEFQVELSPLGPRAEAEMADEIRAILASFPGIQSEVLTFLGDRIGETLTGETAPVAVSLFGDDLDALDAAAREVVRVLSGVPGAADVVLKSPSGAPRLQIELVPERLAALGFRSVDVLEALRAAYSGIPVAQTFRGNQVVDVVVILDASLRRDPEDVGGLLLRNRAGSSVPLRALAEISLTSGRHSILHEGGRRRQTVTCTPSGRDLRSFVAEAKRAIAQHAVLPRGVYSSWSGAAEAESAARRELALHSGVALAGILMLLYAAFRSWRNLLLLLANAPFALIGGTLAAAAMHWLGSGDGGLSIGALVGFVALFGITTRNSIMLISHFEHLVSSEGCAWGIATAIRGASERVVPILMTALVTGLGLVPLALGSGEPGREIEGPMAIVILGGLATSTALNLLVLPTLALHFGRFGEGPQGEP